MEKYLALQSKDRLEKICQALESGKEVKKAIKSINNFIQAPFHFGMNSGNFNLQAFQNEIQAFTRTSDIPEMYTGVYDVFQQMASYDMLGELAFRNRIFDQGKDYFEILDVSNPFTFDRLIEGESVEIKHITGTKSIVQAVNYADGFGWTEDMIARREFSKMVEIATLFKDSWYMKRSKVFYAVLLDAYMSASNANGGIDIPYNTTGATELAKDTKTISAGINAIGTAVKDLGVSTNLMSDQYLLFCSPLRMDRMNDAVRNSLTNPNGGTTISYNVRVCPSWNLLKSDGTTLSTDKAIICLAGGKTQKGDYQLPTLREAEDIKSFSRIMTVKAGLAAAVGEPKQGVVIALS